MRELGDLHDDRHQAPLDLAALVLVGGVAEAILSWLDGSLEMPRAMLIDQCARLTVAAAESVRSTAAP
jgi:hypothetical protein